MAVSAPVGGTFSALNTILYCRRFNETVRFYAETLALVRGRATDWFVEFKVAPGAFISIADEQRTQVKSAAGGGVTLTLRVADAAVLHGMLIARGVDVPPVESRPWNAEGFFIHDPEGNRIEIWSPGIAVEE
jgi:catechol 2,3-dioxygenase-like lactoylglutathione lyase family enzyme